MSESALRASQRETLRVLSTGEWFTVWMMASEFQNSVPSLVRRGLLERRGGGRPSAGPVEVAITDAGRAALKEKGE